PADRGMAVSRREPTGSVRAGGPPRPRYPPTQLASVASAWRPAMPRSYGSRKAPGPDARRRHPAATPSARRAAALEIEAQRTALAVWHRPAVGLAHTDEERVKFIEQQGIAGQACVAGGGRRGVRRPSRGE